MTKQTDDELRAMAARVAGVLHVGARLSSQERTADYLLTYFRNAYSCGARDARASEELPWEWAWGTLNVEEMNSRSAEGWEFVSVVGAGTPVFIWRRRRGVRVGEETVDANQTQTPSR